jgi:tetratricopeptide (TPR) repeat protein
MKNFSLLLFAIFTLSACMENQPASDAITVLKEQISLLEGPPALDTLVARIRQNPNGTEIPELAMIMASVFEQKMADSTASIAVYQAIATGFPGAKEAKQASSRIPKGTPELKKRIEALQASIFDPSKMTLDTTAINQYLNACTVQALLLPSDPQSEFYLHKAAENAYYTQQFSRSLFLYEWFEQAYPQSDKAAQALFMRAFMLDNDLGRFDEAKELYTVFLQKFPNDDFADDAKFLLGNLGKSPEEVIKDWGK